MLFTLFFLSSCKDTNILSSYKNNDNVNVIIFDAYKSALLSKENTYTEEYNLEYIRARKEQFNGHTLDEFYEITNFTVIDMDEDGQLELVLAYGDMGYEVLSFIDGIVYGYDMDLREMICLKADGTFNYSSNFADGGFGKLRISKDSIEIEELAYCESNKKDNGEFEILYFIGNDRVSEIAYEEFCCEQDNKDETIWYDYGVDNIDKVFTSFINLSTE